MYEFYKTNWTWLLQRWKTTAKLQKEANIFQKYEQFSNVTIAFKAEEHEKNLSQRT